MGLITNVTVLPVIFTISPPFSLLLVHIRSNMDHDLTALWVQRVMSSSVFSVMFHWAEIKLLGSYFPAWRL